MSSGFLETTVEAWAAWAACTLLEGGILLILALALWFPVRSKVSAQLGYVVFLAVLVWVALPVGLPAPDWLSGLPAVQWPMAGLRLDATSSGSGSHIGASLWHCGGFGAWFACVVLLVVRHLRKRLRAASLVHRAHLVDLDGLSVDFDELCRRAGVRRPVRLLVSSEINSPAAGGLFSPYVLMPADLLASLREDSLRWVLLHELVHIRRGDLFVSVVQDLANLLVFFNPAVWIANRIVDEQREFACDEAALRISQLSRRACGHGFLSVAEWAEERGRGDVVGLAMFRFRGILRRRLVRLLEEPPRRRVKNAVNASLATAMVFLLMAWGGAVAVDRRVMGSASPARKHESYGFETRDDAHAVLEVVGGDGSSVDIGGEEADPVDAMAATNLRVDVRVGGGDVVFRGRTTVGPDGRRTVHLGSQVP